LENLFENPEILFRIFEFAPDAILLVDSSGRIAQANVQMEKMFGYSRSEVVGRLVEVLIPQRYTEKHIGYRSGYMNSPRTRPMGAGVDLYGRRKDNTEFPVDIMLSPLDHTQGPLILAVIRDATERKKIEEEALRAREMYLKEVHHRVKNNLQVITSLLFLQANHTTDPKTVTILNESQNRVRSIALIHEKLYRTSDFGEIDMADYVRDLVSDLFRAYGVRHERIAMETSVESLVINIDTAIPCGLIINELVSNALKHAFAPEQEGKVAVEISSLGPEEYSLTVRDNGVGLGPRESWGQGDSLGLRLVSDLTRQLDGKMEVEVGSGTTIRIRFKKLLYRDRG
jgi:PAS domain S-box-containing protein